MINVTFIAIAVSTYDSIRANTTAVIIAYTVVGTLIIIIIDIIIIIIIIITSIIDNIIAINNKLFLIINNTILMIQLINNNTLLLSIKYLIYIINFIPFRAWQAAALWLALDMYGASTVRPPVLCCAHARILL